MVCCLWKAEQRVRSPGLLNICCAQVVWAVEQESSYFPWAPVSHFHRCLPHDHKSLDWNQRWCLNALQCMHCNANTKKTWRIEVWVVRLQSCMVVLLDSPDADAVWPCCYAKILTTHISAVTLQLQLTKRATCSEGGNLNVRKLHRSYYFSHRFLHYSRCDDRTHEQTTL